MDKVVENYRFIEFFHRHAPDMCGEIFPPGTLKHRHRIGKDGKPLEYRTRWIRISKDQVEEYRIKYRNFNVFTTINRYINLELEKDEPVIAPLPFDLDHAESGGEVARRSAIKLIKFISSIAVPLKYISIFFSGNRGFHIEVPFQVVGAEPCHNLLPIFKEIALERICTPLKLEGFDATIYSWRRQWRVANSIHPKSRLHKIPITWDELNLPMEDIRRLAKESRFEFPDPSPWEGPPNETLAQWYEESRYKLLQPRKSRMITRQIHKIPSRPDDVSMPESWYPPCVKDALEVGITKKGLERGVNRNRASLVVCTWLKDSGIDREDARKILTKYALEKLAPFSRADESEIVRSTDSRIDAIYNSNEYHFYCEAMRKYGFACRDTCPLFQKNSPRRSGRNTLIPMLAAGKKEIVLAESNKTVEDIRRELPGELSKYLNSEEAGNKILLVTTCPGTSKTITTKRWVNSLHRKGRRCFWIGSRRDLFLNFQEPEDASLWWQPVPRSGVFDDKEGKWITEPPCTFHERAMDLGRKGYDVAKQLCKLCSIGFRCDYYEQFRKNRNKNWFCQQAHLFTDYAKDFDLVVVDEDIKGAFLQEITVLPPDIDSLTALCPLGMGGSDLALFMSRALHEFLNVLKTVIEQNRDSSATGILLLEEIDAECNNLYKKALIELFKDIPPQDRELQDKLAAARPDLSPPPRFVEPLLDVLKYELLQRPEGNNLSRLVIGSDETKMGDRNHIKRFLRINTLRRLPEAVRGKPVIVLDGTGKPELYSRIFKREVLLYSPDVRIRNEVIQVYSAGNSKTTLRHEPAFKKNAELIKELVKKEPKSLIVCKKEFARKFKRIIQTGELPPEVKLANFWGSRGSNEFEECNQVIVLGTPYPRHYDVVHMAGAICYDEPGVFDTSFGSIERAYDFKFRDGVARGKKFRGFREPLLQMIHDTLCHDEIFQSIHRIRPILNSTKRIVLLTDYPVKGIPPNRLLTRNKLMDELTGRVRETRTRKLIKKAMDWAIRHIGFTHPRLIAEMLRNDRDGCFCKIFNIHDVPTEGTDSSCFCNGINIHSRTGGSHNPPCFCKSLYIQTDVPSPGGGWNQVSCWRQGASLRSVNGHYSIIAESMGLAEAIIKVRPRKDKLQVRPYKFHFPAGLEDGCEMAVHYLFCLMKKEGYEEATVMGLTRGEFYTRHLFKQDSGQAKLIISDPCPDCLIPQKNDYSELSATINAIVDKGQINEQDTGNVNHTGVNYSNIPYTYIRPDGVMVLIEEMPERDLELIREMRARKFQDSNKN